MDLKENTKGALNQHLLYSSLREEVFKAGAEISRRRHNGVVQTQRGRNCESTHRHNDISLLWKRCQMASTSCAKKAVTAK